MIAQGIKQKAKPTYPAYPNEFWDDERRVN